MTTTVPPGCQRVMGVVSLERTLEASVRRKVLVLDISSRTVRHDWDFAKAWLSRELNR
jgi:hypothetical protein